MENILEFKNEKYYATACSNIYRTQDGKKIFYLDGSGKPVWLFSDTAIHIELREDVMMESLWPHGDLSKCNKGIINDNSSRF